MTMTKIEKYRDDLLIDLIAERLQFHRVANALPVSVDYTYLWVAVGLFVEYGIFDLYNFFVSGKVSFITDPASLSIPAMTIIGVIGLKYIHDSYADAVLYLGMEDENIDIEENIQTEFEGLVSLRLRLAGYIVSIFLYYIFVIFVLTIPNLIGVDGLGLVMYSQLVSFPLIIIPIFCELGISYVAVHISIPRRIAKTDFGLFYYDPENLGGFKPIGQLLKRSYYIYTLIVLLWFFETHAPILLSEFTTSPYGAARPILQVVLSAVWGVGVLTIGYSMYRMHSIMKLKKEAKLRELKHELKVAIKDPHDINLSNIENRGRYDDAQEMIPHVKNTKTYPTTFTMWSQIFISVILPQALNMAVQLPE